VAEKVPDALWDNISLQRQFESAPHTRTKQGRLAPTVVSNMSGHSIWNDVANRYICEIIPKFFQEGQIEAWLAVFLSK